MRKVISTCWPWDHGRFFRPLWRPSPALALDDGIDATRRNPIGFRERDLCQSTIPNGSPDHDDLRLVEPGAPIFASTMISGVLPTLNNHVLGIGNMVPKEEMIRPNTRGIVATMAYKRSFRNRPIGQFPGQSVSINGLSLDANLAISLGGGSLPVPATGSSSDVLPESGFNTAKKTCPADPIRIVTSPGAVLALASSDGRGSKFEIVSTETTSKFDHPFISNQQTGRLTHAFAYLSKMGEVAAWMRRSIGEQKPRNHLRRLDHSTVPFGMQGVE